MRRDDAGSVTAFVAVIAVALMFVAGMVVDGGAVVVRGAEARRLASSAARAGAQEIDVEQLRATGRPTLATRQAESAALDFLAAAGTTGDVRVSDTRVTVTLVVVHRPRLLPGPVRHISATRTARATPGITSPGDLP